MDKKNSAPAPKKVTTRSFQIKKQQKQPISMLTAYDYPTALAAEKAGIDSILVGDSLGMVVLGYDNTLPVTMADMIHHCKAVARGASTPLLIGDMPFMSYQSSVKKAVENAGRFLQEAGMDAVKLEGGRERADAITAMVQAGIPVIGHLGLTPQSVHAFGGFRAQGKTSDAAMRLIEDAHILQQAGAFGIVLEAVPAQLAGLISEQLEIPTIGIGAGANCDGQVLVTHDLIGQFDRFVPSFVRQYAQIHTIVLEAMQHYHQDVQDGKFPAEEHSIYMDDQEWNTLIKLLESRRDE
ncbi:MAG: 3-methyl-2-oxobutanoate hydroxymethyltransferase [Anaerolineales bacterium]|nr:3-methyl-2-oxobutanoate hydroxymethyltransferase [Anaerolineales bacterium]